MVGIPEEQVFREIGAITNAISDSCEPAIIPDVYLQNISGKTVIVAEISAGRQKPYYIKADGLENGVYIRVPGTTRPADRDMSGELYYECDGRSYDSVIRTDLEVTDEDIQTLCRQMKEVALANSKLALQRESVRDVTKSDLLNWGLLKKADGGKVYPTNAYVYLTGQDGCVEEVKRINGAASNFAIGKELLIFRRKDGYGTEAAEPISHRHEIHTEPCKGRRPYHVHMPSIAPDHFFQAG